MVTQLEGSGGLSWRVFLPGLAVLVLAAVFLWNVLDPAKLATSMASSGTHSIEIYEISKAKSLPFRVVSIEGENFFHPPVGHTAMFVHFDKSPNNRLIWRLKKEAKETYAYQSDAEWEEQWEDTEWED